jgi:hypothetical protein
MEVFLTANLIRATSRIEWATFGIPAVRHGRSVIHLTDRLQSDDLEPASPRLKEFRTEAPKRPFTSSPNRPSAVGRRRRPIWQADLSFVLAQWPLSGEQIEDSAASTRP